ncbi:MAG: ribosome-associated translation inhibitor RaiA [Sphingomonadaceae bacterium]|uniref:ribosome hibernation-promoting factor, HPF/YfiA family n=1 Tax=Thermaurantiacus sp. TaxID=2820283 RepID=UPI00298F2182|nr:ribosome-associated translation inhibitor RaiA [Thermaurantiacus sp.]MCS6987664.1 ribosome-associated translation inhibitor RaiA [Sphingomonadaceae bacterium]MDW8415265.1 ribosome-associated translation inhibitor RaiA [Thermaurantiacus sp.]
MEIRVSGHQVATGEAFRTHVEARLKAMAEQYFSRALSAQVTLSPGPHGSFTCDIVCHVMHGLVLKGSNRAATAYLAFDGAADRIEKQLRRYMRRLKSRNGAALDTMAVDTGVPENADYRIFRAEPEDAEPGDAPLTIAEMKVDIPEATVSDAVMMLDLRNTPALLFTNAATGKLNMVYRREDGNIGWVEPRG